MQIADYAAQQTGDFYDGLSLALEAMLISPDFIFIADRAEADPDAPGQQRLDAYSLASRLSFLLWNAPPDDVLLKKRKQVFSILRKVWLGQWIECSAARVLNQASGRSLMI